MARGFMMRFDHSSTAVVTGAASGIGAALAAALDAKGVQVALCDVDEAGLAKVASTLQQTPLTETVDVSDSDAVHRFAKRVLQEHGPPDLTIANAGVALAGDFLSGTPEEWEWIFGVNFWGVVYTCRAFLPAMIERDKGWLVNISSVFGLIGVPNCSAYCATKAAVKGFTESLDLELRDSRVGVSCVHPGGIATNIVNKARSGANMFGGQSRDRSARIIANGMHPDRAASIILHGAEREKKRILVGRDAWVLDKIQRLAPVGYRRLIELASKTR